LKQLDCEIETISFEEPIDSSNMNPGEWARIAIVESNYLILMGLLCHGSDTMSSYSASALSFMLENLAKPVILPVHNYR
jgi:L-asparaginase